MLFELLLNYWIYLTFTGGWRNIRWGTWFWCCCNSRKQDNICRNFGLGSEVFLHIYSEYGLGYVVFVNVYAWKVCLFLEALKVTDTWLKISSMWCNWILENCRLNWLLKFIWKYIVCNMKTLVNWNLEPSDMCTLNLETLKFSNQFNFNPKED